MSYFHDPNYVNSQLRRLIVKSVQTEGADGNADGIAKRFRDWEMFTGQKPLYVLLIDFVGSIRFTPNEKKLIDPFCLFAATDITARGGFVFRQTDGFEAFFNDKRRALESALSLHRRKPQIQDQIFRPVLERLRQSRTPEEAQKAQEDDYRKDYRIVLCVIRPEHLTSWFEEAGFGQDGNRQVREENATEAVVNGWFEICSRIGTQHSFVVSREYYHLHLDEDQRKLFVDKPVPLDPPKALHEGRVKQLFQKMGLSQLHPYQGSPALQHEPEVSRQQGRYTAQKLEEIYEEGYKKLKDYYNHNCPAVSPLSDLFRLEPADIIKNPLTAAVFGDINIDSVCSLDDDFNIPKGANHIQRREHMDKDIGGKGYLMARELDALGTSFDCIRLVGKLGIDSEMPLILQDLKQHQRIEPILFFSSQYRTGSTFSLRRKNDKRALLTITDEPSANSRLTLKEVEGRLQEIVELSDYIFVSGYCLLDERLEIVERIVGLLSDRTAEEPRKLILEFSPRTLYEKRFAHSPDKLRNLLEKTFLLVFEAGAFPQDAETDLVAKPLFCLKLDFGSEKQFERSRTVDWTEQPFRLGNNTWKKGTVGLTNQLMTQHIDAKFWKPRILLCSRSPRRFSLLANVYDKFAIHPYLLKAPAPEFGDQIHFSNVREALEKLANVALEKLSASLNALAQDREPLSNTIKAAITSDLVVMAKDPSRKDIEILDEPDSDEETDAKAGSSSLNNRRNINPVDRVREYLKTFLSGKSHEVWSCSVILKIPRDAFHPKGYLEKDFCQGVETNIPKHVKEKGLNDLGSSVQS